MIDLESDRPFFHWCADSLDLNQRDSGGTIERSLWHHTPVVSYVITDWSITFYAPAEWGDGLAPIRLQRTSDGGYEDHLKGTLLKCVRAETQSHVVMTGRWVKGNAGSGVFIGVFPIELTDELQLETATSVPELSYVAVAIANP